MRKQLNTFESCQAQKNREGEEEGDIDTQYTQRHTMQRQRREGGKEKMMNSYKALVTIILLESCGPKRMRNQGIKIPVLIKAVTLL